jgi:glycosyltransferase involved in cell wall biosynthesis
MEKPRFFYLEPSKAGDQHITLIQGYLQALVESPALRLKYEFHLGISRSTRDNLPHDLVGQFKLALVPVMHPQKRRLVRKSFLEFFLVLWYLLKLKAGDVLFVSCMLPTSLFLLEKLGGFFRGKNVYIVVHGEVEGILMQHKESIFRIGHWAAKWFRSRKASSPFNLVVLDDFIKTRLISESNGMLNEHNVFVVHHPIFPYVSRKRDERPDHSIAFLGYRTAFKGYETFARLATRLAKCDFKVIGGGKQVSLKDGASADILSTDDYLEKVASSTVALFPYSARYDCSLSAAALDALATGTFIVASPRPFFDNLSKQFDRNFMIVYGPDDQLEAVFENLDFDLLESRRGERIKQVQSSKYSIGRVSEAFENMVA